MERSDLEQALDALGQLLDERQQGFEIYAIGGGSLLLTGHIVRPTADLDVLALGGPRGLESARPLPGALETAVAEVADLFGLSPTWVNPGPTDLLTFGLPEGFLHRTIHQQFGPLVIRHAGRFDQVCFKLYAAVDNGPRSKHANDLRRLGPTSAELIEAGSWAITHDPSEEFLDQLRQTLEWLDGRPQN